MDSLFNEAEFYNVREMLEEYDSNDFLYNLSKKVYDKSTTTKELSELEDIVLAISTLDMLVFGLKKYCRNMGPGSIKKAVNGLKLIGAKKTYEIFKEIDDLINENNVGWPENINSDDDEFIDYKSTYYDFIDSNSSSFPDLESKYYEVDEEDINDLFYNFVKNELN